MIDPAASENPYLPLRSSALLTLRSRILSLVERRHRTAWADFVTQLRVLSEDTALEMQELCGGPPACVRVLARLDLETLRDAPASEVPDGRCAALMAERLTLARLRRAVRAETASKDISSQPSPGDGELRALARLRQHRAEARLLFDEVKSSLWISTVRGALLEASALILRLEAECTLEERAELSRGLERAVEGDEAGSRDDLGRMAEHAAAQYLRERLGSTPDVRRRHRASAHGEARPGGM